MVSMTTLNSRGPHSASENSKKNHAHKKSRLNVSSLEMKESLFCLRDTPDRGVGVFAASDISSGTILFIEQPFGFAVCPSLRRRVCRECCCMASDEEEEADFLFFCPRCKMAFYCSDLCMQAHHNLHAQECNVLTSFLRHHHTWNKVSDDDQTFLLSLLSVQNRRLLNHEDFARFQQLMPLAEADDTLEMFFLIISLLINEGWNADNVFCDTLDQFQQDCFREQVNAFGLFEISPKKKKNSSLECFGRAVYLQGSRFNHSCCPNVTRVRCGRDMIFLTNRDIRKDEELCITYVDLGRHVDDRQKTLLEDYAFFCTCQRCQLRDQMQWGQVCDQCSGETLRMKGKKLCVHHDRQQLVDILFHRDKQEDPSSESDFE